MKAGPHAACIFAKPDTFNRNPFNVPPYNGQSLRVRQGKHSPPLRRSDRTKAKSFAPGQPASLDPWRLPRPPARADDPSSRELAPAA